jgi:hypothetical protein
MQSESPFPEQPLAATTLRKSKQHLVLGVFIVTFALTIVPIAAPSFPSAADQLKTYVTENAQSLNVPAHATLPVVERATYTATAGVESLVASGTNYDWAKMVLMFGGWPQSDANVTVITRWMRQENGANNWFNRNNPLNNGWGSGGGGGTGRYASLVVAAEKAADALTRNGGYAAIRANLAASSPTEVTEAAIWASPWASGHYANGGHWHYTPVDVVVAPAGAWQ